MSVVYATLWFNFYDRPNCAIDGSGQRHVVDFESGQVLPFCSQQSVKRVMRDFFGVVRYHKSDELKEEFGEVVGPLVYSTLANSAGSDSGSAYVDLDAVLVKFISDYQASPKPDHAEFLSGLKQRHREFLDVWGGVVGGDKPQNKAKIWASPAWMVTGQGFRSHDSLSGSLNDLGSMRVSDGYWVIVFGAADGKPADMLKEYLQSEKRQMTYAVAQRSSACRNDKSSDGTVGSSDVGFGSRLVEALQVRSAALFPVANLRHVLEAAAEKGEPEVVKAFTTWASLAPNAPSFRKVVDNANSADPS